LEGVLQEYQDSKARTYRILRTFEMKVTELTLCYDY